MPKADLHVLSAHSKRPPEWILRQLGIAESYTDPEHIFDVLSRNGFEFITITDVDSIEGCLAIADRPGTFISQKITATFPEDHCKVHVLAWDITEAQHQKIQGLRDNIYELAAFLHAEKIVHGVATPLRSINLKLTVDHVEKLILLFSLFEGMNATDAPLAQEVWRQCIEGLTQERLDEMAERQGIEPHLPAPQPRRLFAGSGDYAGMYIGAAYSQVDKADTVQDFLSQLHQGQAQLQGRGGDVCCFSTSLYKILVTYATRRMSITAPHGVGLLKQVAERFLAGHNPAEISLGERFALLAEAVRTGKALDFIKPNDVSLNREIAMYFLDPAVKNALDEIIHREPTPERRTFAMSSKIANDLIFRLFNRTLEQIESGNLIDSLQPATGMLPILAGISPYILSYHALYGNRYLVEKVADRALPERPPCLRNEKRAWFTDTLDDVNGVARTIRTMSKVAIKADKDLTVVISATESDKGERAENQEGFQLKNFPPVGDFELPEYKLQKLSFPPVLDMIDYIERERFTECIISTPGPVGLTALAAAKLLGLRTCGIYHTDFPQYVRILTDDGLMETMMWQYMHWFYAQMDRVYVNSEFYRKCWVDRGIPYDRIHILSRGLDTETFHHQKRNEHFWQKRGAKHPVVLYVGRVSKEKELEFLARVYQKWKEEGIRLDLAIVGEGPYEEELKQIIPDAIFTGVLHGDELGMAYASSEFFAFPSTTDTFGNVVVEAIASGLPALVSDVGGPKEIVHEGQDGKVLSANDIDQWSSAVREWADNPIPRSQRIENANRVHQDRSWNKAFSDFWNGIDSTVK
ncbi:MAG: glycosyltransferase [Verrucomicrobiota bacterium]